jgi:hypothetical protein
LDEYKEILDKIIADAVEATRLTERTNMIKFTQHLFDRGEISDQAFHKIFLELTFDLDV